MSDRVSIHRDGHIAHVELSRPDKINALDPPMFEALAAAGDELRADATVRCVVLSGSGRGFSAGLDFASFAALATDPSGLAHFMGQYPGSPANRAQQAAWTWVALPVPVVAAIHGVCFGGGLQVALGADLRIVAADAQLSVMEIKWGLIPDMSGPQTMRRVLPLDVAKELTFSGRVVDGREAVSLGLATRVADDPLEEAFAVARSIAAQNPDAIRAAKRLLDTTWQLPPEEGLALEARLQTDLIGSANQLEAVAANLQNRAPQFRDPS